MLILFICAEFVLNRELISPASSPREWPLQNCCFRSLKPWLAVSKAQVEPSQTLLPKSSLSLAVSMVFFGDVQFSTTCLTSAINCPHHSPGVRWKAFVVQLFGPVMTSQVWTTWRTMPASLTRGPAGVSFVCRQKGRNGDRYSWLDFKRRKAIWWVIGMPGRLVSLWTWACQHCQEEINVCPERGIHRAKMGISVLSLITFLCISSLMAPKQVLNIQAESWDEHQERSPPLLSVAVYTPKATLTFHRDTHSDFWLLFPIKNLLKQKSCYWTGDNWLSLMQHGMGNASHQSSAELVWPFCLMALLDLNMK